MGEFKSDKGLQPQHNRMDITVSWHNYTPIYFKLFNDIRYKELRIFELGLGTNNSKFPCYMGEDANVGASLYGWEKFFPNSKIFGADIDSDVLFNTDKIKTYYCDQTNSAVVQDMWKKNELEEDFDIIIDDGLHALHANSCFFENSIHKLKPNGFFIIEDISNNSIHKEEYQNKINEWKVMHPNLYFNLVSVPSNTNQADNNLIIIYKPQL
jgi:SAM-dependent methyltransferase